VVIKTSYDVFLAPAVLIKLVIAELSSKCADTEQCL